MKIFHLIFHLQASHLIHRMWKMCAGRSLSIIISSSIKCKRRKTHFMIVIKLAFGRRVVVHNHKWYHMISSGESKSNVCACVEWRRIGPTFICADKLSPIGWLFGKRSIKYFYCYLLANAFAKSIRYIILMMERIEILDFSRLKLVAR